MPNLAHALSQTQGEIVHFPKTGQNAMSKKEEGFTRLPNVLIDTQIMAELNDKAFKCLMFIIRQTLGFDRESHTISITQFQKHCGIKKEETVARAIAELEDTKLIKVDRKKGCLNKYLLTLNQYHQTVVPPLKGGSTIEGGESTTHEQGGSTPVEQGTNKENLKENLNKEKKTLLVDNSENEMFDDSVKYHEGDKKQYSLRELANVYTVQTDLAEQAKRIDPKLDDAKILSELKNFAQWSTSREKTTAQGWMNYWIYRIQKLVAPKAKSQKTTKAKSKSLSDAQINYFVSELCNYSTFASLYSNVGETQKSFEARISANLRKPEYAKTYGPYLAELGFVVDLGPEL
ncbi:replication protein [Acinetobacter sp. SwsAc6]|uniref:replication protein n=1 Tax=Acinetobacter sp. SwsAc6 TaxID=2749439 RepID=UPI0015BFAAB8|nr:replication protein [Acinetobacter sp. SwsAc6]NWK73151.1 replication protein [Acinetobacter sp. SwsAc6]